jgi:Phage stabilisation protein
MKIGLVGPSYQQRSLSFDAQRSVNLFPIADPQGADVAALYGTPGLTLFATAGTGVIRGGISTADVRTFFVSGSALYEISSAGVATLLGTLNTSSGIVTMADNGFQLGICDGTSVYMYTYLTSVFAKVTDPDLPSAANISFVNGYFVVTKNNSGQFYISALYDGTSWSALDFASAESSPDNLSIATNFVGQLGLFGHDTLEIWRNTGDSTFPFARISGATPIGTIAPNTVISLDTSVYWVGNTNEGSGIVYQAQGFTPKRISTEAIEKILQAEPNPSTLRSWGYQEEGHAFLVITGGSLSTSLVYDLTTQLWHERSFLNSAGNDEQHLGSCCVYAFNSMQLVGSRVDGKIYRMSLNLFDDNGSAISRRRVYTHLIDELNPVRYTDLQIGFETGVGLQTGQGSNPTVSLRISKDGARKWTDYYTTSIGAVGNYNQQVKFRRLGINQQCTFEISITDPVKVAITGSYLNRRGQNG